jgi:hypothetical protein
MMLCRRNLAPAITSCMVVLAACAGERPRPAPQQQASPLPPSPMPRSSLVAVLAHRDELALDGAQVAKLEQLERELERRQASLLEVPPSRVRGPTGTDSESRRTRGGRARTGRGREGSPPPESQAQLFDDADTAAFLEAERALREPQREPARAIAESYREALADARDRSTRGAGTR